MNDNRSNVVACETSTKKNKIKFLWDDVAVKEFIDACVLELRKGNRPGTHFNKTGWDNIEKNMFEKTGKTLDKKQIKNKWDILKKEWKLYVRLMSLETGIGGTRSLIDASPEWWEEKIKANKDFAKFKVANLDIFETHYALLFRDSIAVGDQAMNPSQFQNDSNINIEGKGDSDEMILGDDEPLFPSFVESSSGKRKMANDVGNKRSTKSKTSSFEEKLDVVLDALSTKSIQTFPPNNPSPTVADCMGIVITFFGFEEGSKDYSRALRVLTKRQNRESFMFPTTHEALQRPDLHFPHPTDKYYVVDAGYPNTKGYLAPYKGANICYHIPDFKRGQTSAMRAPRGQKETFNYHHSSSRNIIERTFGVWKARWALLRDMHVNYTYKHQVSIVIASMAIHNYIRKAGRFDEAFNRAQQESYNPGGDGTSNETNEEVPATTRTNDDVMYMAAIRDIIAQDVMESRR